MASDLKKILENKYMPCFISFARKRTPNFSEAEELAQEIVFQCIKALHSHMEVSDYDKYFWSIAHNTYKRWCSKRREVSLESEYDTFSNIECKELPIVNLLIEQEEENRIRLEVSRLADLYRKTLVCFYYDGLTIPQIAVKLDLSVEMIKYYLSRSRSKLKEAYTMDRIGEKSFNPSEFTIYKSGIDFSKVNVWEVFKRKLPCQIAIICHDSAKTISEISAETGTPAVYIEDELELLLDAGVFIRQTRDKYRTNFHIINKETAIQIKEQFKNLYAQYVPLVIQSYEKHLAELKECDVFKFDAASNQWAWYFAMNVPDFDYTSTYLTADDYSQILSCGSKSIIFAEAVKGSVWAAGRTPTYLEKCDVWPCDVVAFGEYHCQKELWDKNKAQALYDVYVGDIKEKDKNYYAELIQEGYVIKQDGKLLSNVAVTSSKSRKFFEKINEELTSELKKICGSIRNNIYSIVKSTLPDQLKAYTKGYAETWISFYAGVYLNEELHNQGFIVIPSKDDLTPVACCIYEK